MCAAATAERLVLSVSAVPLSGGRYDGAMARWIEQDLLGSFRSFDVDERVVIATEHGRKPVAQGQDADRPRASVVDDDHDDG